MAKSFRKGQGPRLRFNYKAPDDTTLCKYESRAFVDSYRADYETAPYWKTGGCFPTSRPPASM